MTTVIHHNPACGTSRNVLAIIRSTGAEPVVVEYLETGWTKPQLQALFAAAGLTAREALRVSKTTAEAQGLTRADVTEEELLEAMVADPVLVNRPIVCSPKGVALCRPSEAVLPLLEAAPSLPVVKEDGTVILDDSGNPPA